MDQAVLGAAALALGRHVQRRRARALPRQPAPRGKVNRRQLPENFQRHLQIVFASRLGFNLRNVVAHGLLPASQFSILTSLMSLQGLLIMSLVEAGASERLGSTGR